MRDSDKDLSRQHSEVEESGPGLRIQGFGTHAPPRADCVM